MCKNSSQVSTSPSNNWKFSGPEIWSAEKYEMKNMKYDLQYNHAEKIFKREISSKYHVFFHKRLSFYFEKNEQNGGNTRFQQKIRNRELSQLLFFRLVMKNNVNSSRFQDKESQEFTLFYIFRAQRCKLCNAVTQPIVVRQYSCKS